MNGSIIVYLLRYFFGELCFFQTQAVSLLYQLRVIFSSVHKDNFKTNSLYYYKLTIFGLRLFSFKKPLNHLVTQLVGYYVSAENNNFRCTTLTAFDKCVQTTQLGVDMYIACSNSRSLLEMYVAHSIHISLNSKDIFYEGSMLSAGIEMRSLYRTTLCGYSIIWKKLNNTLSVG